MVCSWRQTILLLPKLTFFMATSYKTKVAIADDCQITRQLLKEYLHDIPEIKIVIESPNGKVLLDEIVKSPPDIVLMDVIMGTMNGIEATREIKRINPEIKVIGWSVHCDKHTVIQMVKAGAVAFLDKDTKLKELRGCICSVHTKGYYDNQYLTHVMRENIMNPDNKDLHVYEDVILTDHDILLMQLIGSGKNNPQMADELSVCLRKVQKDVKGLFGKTNTDNIVMLVKYGIRNGIIPL